MDKTVLRLVLGLAVALSGAARAGAQGSATWVNVTGNLANMPSECGNMSFLSSTPGSPAVIAGIALRGLWRNTSGTTWVQLGTGAGSDTITNRATWIEFDRTTPGVFWESGIYNGGGIFKTADNGNTFTRQGSIIHNDYVSVDMSDPGRQTLLAGGHEQGQTVYRSTNGGATWTNIGTTMPVPTKHTTHPLVVGPQTYVVNSSGWGAGTGGIFRTTNGGASWQQVSTQEPIGPPLVTTDGTIYWLNWDVLVKSTDGGATWTRVGSNLQPVSPIQLPDGRIAAVRSDTPVASSDGGVTWTAIGPAMPYAPHGIAYSASRQAMFIWRSDCGGVVPANAVMQLDLQVNALVPGAPTNLRIVSSE
jgi:photosystem II stability/assembly factor-like uncharacterized protein